MRRHLLNLLTLLSLLLCVAVTALWVRSYWRWDSLRQHGLWVDSRAAAGQSYCSSSGRLWLTRSHGALDFENLQYEEELRRRERKQGLDPSRWRYSGLPHDRAKPPPGRLGFHFFRRQYQLAPGATMSVLSFGVPHGLIAGLAAVLPAVRTRNWLRYRRRHGLGACPSCGYDLRATPDRCPECGMMMTDG
jgi:hypothetical protein